MWDVASSRVVAKYEAHSKRVWSLDYCGAPAAGGTLLASASDDCTVKLWSTQSPNSVGQASGAAECQPAKQQRAWQDRCVGALEEWCAQLQESPSR